MGRMVDVDELIDAVECAQIAGFKSPTAVSVYLSRGSFPEPLIDRGGRRTRLWLRKDVLNWVKLREKSPGTR